MILLLNNLYYFNIFFIKTFFFDKYNIQNIYEYPLLKKLTLNIFFNKSNNLKNEIYKYLLLSILLTKKKPKLQILNINAKGLKKKKIIGLHLLLSKGALYNFLQLIITRKIPLIKFFSKFNFNHLYGTFFFKVSNYLYDDELLLQVLEITQNFTFYLYLQISVKKFNYLKSFLVSLKFPF